MLINNLSNERMKIEEDFKWITLKQIKQLILENAIINPHLRSLNTGIPVFSQICAPSG